MPRHDAILRESIERHHGVVVKTTGDGVHAAFADPRDAVAATLAAQMALADDGADRGLALRVRCGMHAGVTDRTDGDYFGSAVNRAARIMSAAHGGQVLLSQTVADLVRESLAARASTLRDLGAVRLRDLASAERLYQVAACAVCAATSRRCARWKPMPNNLPQQVTSFIGREREQRRSKRLLRTTRLLTLTGVGGLGKTRLSLQVAADVIDDFPDGVWFVELAPLADARLVPQAVASVLGVKEEAGRPISEALAQARARRATAARARQLRAPASQACARAGEALLQAGPRVKILATSREPLRCRRRDDLSACRRFRFPTRRDRITAESIAAMRSGAPVRRTRDGGAAGVSA